MEMEENLSFEISIDQILAKFYEVFYLKKIQAPNQFLRPRHFCFVVVDNSNLNVFKKKFSHTISFN